MRTQTRNNEMMFSFLQSRMYAAWGMLEEKALKWGYPWTVPDDTPKPAIRPACQHASQLMPLPYTCRPGEPGAFLSKSPRNSTIKPLRAADLP